MTDVVLVDKKGEELGLLEKLKAHHNPGFLHKAISVVLYKKTDKGVKFLLQKRAKSKPLWPGFWANTVCTHPINGETNLDCAVRRLKEEVGIVMVKKDLKELYTFYYQADYSAQYSEHEMDTVIVGKYYGRYKLNTEEVMDISWIDLMDLGKAFKRNPGEYSPWLKMIILDKRFQKDLNI